jgi:CheY-like chemotaxis protein
VYEIQPIQETRLGTENTKKDDGIFAIVPKNSQVPIILLAIFSAGVIVLVLGGFTGSNYLIIPALIWAFGFCTGGMLLGFLFAIPRTLPSGAIVAPTPGPSGTASGTDKGKQANSETTSGAGYNEINSNLVEVSDWLTKIIVGVGLVELKDLPQNAASVANFIAPSLGIATISAVPIAGGIMLFFSVLGFLIGYLLTRIYLAVIIKWADNMVKIQNDPTVRLRSSQREIGVSELSLLQQDALSDLQQTVVELASATPQTAASMEKVDAAVAPPTPASKQRVLWVDDKPENNTLLVEQLNKAGIEVDEPTSTQQALKLLDQNVYSAIVSDMGRVEGKNYIGDAGIVLAEQVKLRFPNMPFIIFTSREGVRLHEAAAQKAGVRLVTTSGTRLIAALNQILT